MKWENDNLSNDIAVSILQNTEKLHRLKDVNTILDRILTESRKLANADAGSIFLLQDDELKFSYVHNDTLFTKAESSVELYSSFTVPVNERSIVGYTAKTGKIIDIADAYDIPDNLPYSFEPSYDRKTGYKTTSMLSIPLKSFDNRMVGVMQLINAKNEQRQAVPFSKESLIYVPLFANNASVAIEHGVMTRELILRMVKMAELRDPSETGAHVQRVGAYSAEIYQKWASNRKLDNGHIRHNKDLIRLAAMLHDVGKVGISDTILKKPSRLTEQEFDIMKWHTVFGARLFSNNTSDLDQMSLDIALNHHEKWGGAGYPGHVSHITGENLDICVTPKKKEEIPITARITALADVFDALASKRSYKDPWPEERILSVIDEESGRHFDPEVVEAFFQIFDIIKAIQDKYNSDQV
ncbi:HD domain-containing protein [Desulfobacterales bacterium HSG16]|nr:HD domain-containing protein [Desulfobacterales bacterium HSG16]